MTSALYIPVAGEIVWTDFDPAVGREQAGRRPALVVSATAFNEATGLAVVCPITSRVRPFPSSVVLPPDLTVSGEILVSHVRSIDVLARPVRASGVIAPEAIVEQVKAKLRSVLEI